MLSTSFDINSIIGLSEQESEERLKREGYNELPSAKQRSIFAIAIDVVREPMFILLVACGIIYLILGDMQEALMLLGFVIVVIGITLYQERKTERAIEALRDLSSPRAMVIRGGMQKRIPGRDVVRGDIIVLNEGDRVPADAVLLSCINLSVDESLLTGESAPVRKTACAGITEMVTPGGEDRPCVYSGTLIVKGQGIATVQATAGNTEMGRIGKALQSVELEETQLQRETRKIVRELALAGLSVCALVIIVYGLTRGSWLNGFLAGITLAMALLPEEFPVVLTIFLALGAWRISQKRVLTRRVPAVETLGSATVLCVDKTGTLTQNRMSVHTIYVNGDFYTVDYLNKPGIPENFHEIVEFSILASQKDPFEPMEKAFKELGDHYLASTEHMHDDWTLVREYPLSNSLMALSHVWKSPKGDEYVIAAKGAPEAIADLCHFSEGQKQELAKSVETMAMNGLRILGVAKSHFTTTELPGEQHDFTFEFLGLVGLADPVRSGVAEAVKECYTAGIRVVMITGDYAGTAAHIARKIGLKTVDQLVTGLELDGMDDGELQRRIKNVNIFARVVPEQKLRIVNALKAIGEVVAMTGDGVNDAPALRSAHIGIAMGGRGTDVAREASALVLLDDDFASIVQAVRMGRRIFDNLRKAIAYIFAVHVPIAGMSLLPVLFKWPLVLLPVHIVFLELIIDPACSVVFEAEPEEADVMTRPPRRPDAQLFGTRTVGISLLQGLSVMIILLGVFVISLKRGQSEEDARALTFTTLIIANLGLIFTNRSWTRIVLDTLRSPNAALWWVTGGALAFLGLALYVPFLRNLFRFSFLHAFDIFICFVAGVVSILWFEVMKWVNNRSKQGAVQVHEH
ncbi:MAG TPA: cation-translocating P-type ATPase [Nitrospirota bacterium]|nr:cation-translocating P-type ATPase [Nitrospirota bacterium]